MTAQWQLNGLVMLYAYLQRVFVYDKVIATIPGDTAVPVSVENLPSMLERTSKAIGAFDTETGLSDADQRDFAAILDAVRAALSDRATHANAPLRDRLAAIAGDRLGGQYLLEGLVLWGDRYSAAAADRFRQKVLPARGAANEVTRLVADAARDALTADDHARVDSWYTEVARASAGSADDLALVSELLAGRGRQ
ncbi:hypothetical protein [Jongsikchunia kroppenstedtii]|uniref:hypothetical protein n=1 Tax=Jongsikchunia kroppenstedtii TaxID=1121721 RepID=UPI00035C9BE9|nr:hypothetical protein [Jongsikchunia kroppenstedtii]